LGFRKIRIFGASEQRTGGVVDSGAFAAFQPHDEAVAVFCVYDQSLINLNFTKILDEIDSRGYIHLLKTSGPPGKLQSLLTSPSALILWYSVYRVKLPLTLHIWVDIADVF
jgi:hypothetical protein